VQTDTCCGCEKSETPRLQIPSGHDESVGVSKRGLWAGAAGIGCAGMGAWLAQWLGGNAATIGLGAMAGAVSGAFAPSIQAAILARGKAQDQIALSAEQPRPLVSPARLLDPRCGVVRFTGRADELTDLLAWCEKDSVERLRLLTGPGGIGKTRLAMQLADRLKELGWRCELVGEGQEGRILADVRAVSSGRVFLVVDYAETRISLKALLRAVVADDGAAARVLLLARSAGQWWEQLAASEVAIRDLVSAAGSRGTPLREVLDEQVTDE
jgi:hypothetical protein